jgi:hypothetical protein
MTFLYNITKKNKLNILKVNNFFFFINIINYQYLIYNNLFFY